MRKVRIHLGGSEITLRDQRLILLFCALRRAQQPTFKPGKPVCSRLIAASVNPQNRRAPYNCRHSWLLGSAQPLTASSRLLNVLVQCNVQGC
jgi:hypothetical protein